MAALAETPRVHAIVGARVVTAPGKTIEKGTVVVRDGLVAAVGANAQVPADARVWNGEGLTVYPGLIDPFVTPPAPERPDRAERAGSGHVLESVTPERRMAEAEPLSDEQRDALRQAGFTAIQLVPRDGVVRGQGAVVSLDDGAPNDVLLRADASQSFAIASSGNWGTYPGSRMGGIAVIRQAFLDAEWYRAAQAAYVKSRGKVERPEFNVAWDALAPVVAGEQMGLFVAEDMLGVIAAAQIAKEAKIRACVLDAGDAYKRAGDIARTGLTLIVPVNYPEAPDVQDPADAVEVTTEELRHWQNAPGNAAVLARSGVPFVFTSNGLEKTSSFLENVRQAIERGLDADQALAAMTLGPAKLLGLEDRLGTIEPGRIANFTVTTGDLFSKTSEVREVWVDGNRHEIGNKQPLEGRWALRLESGASMTLIVKEGRPATVRLVAEGDTLKADDVQLDAIRLAFRAEVDGVSGEYTLTSCLGRLCGSRRVLGASGRTIETLSGYRLPNVAEGREEREPPRVEAPVVMGDPEAWRRPIPEQAEAVLVKNATVWTAGPEGTLEGADLLVRRGKIAAVGRGLQAPAGALLVDGAGKHVMPGIIDEHSHAAIIGGVNECTNSNTAEVRIQDVINSESVDIYRQLASGVSVMHLLHGSCNAIGGQCAAIKNRWGAAPEGLLLHDMAPTIKFALGENVKGSNVTTGARAQRYPQTRGGVEQVYRDAFQAARDYRAAWQEYRSGKSKMPPRRDLNLEALVEILEGKRQVHCHSYRQDEILMLIRVADDFGFKINTFTHILEGYKVADEMARHGAAGSAFSDWWAYKFEVYDAIPYNGYLMWDRGVLVAYNSDSGELARRLHSEAAKAVKYGGVPKEEAVKFVTLNPAKMLRIDDRVGSLEVGKDADFSLWSGTPLSPYSVCEQTWVDGRKYFDREADLAAREPLAKEREALIANARAAKEKGGRGGGRSPAYLYLQESDLTGNDCGGELLRGGWMGGEEVGR